MAKRMSWLEKAREYAYNYADTYRFVTSDEVLRAVGKPKNSGLIGKVFQSEEFRSVGSIESTRKSNKGRRINIWALN